MELVGALSNLEVQSRLRRLSEKLDGIATSEVPRRPTAFAGRRRPGALTAAIEQVLAAAACPMRMYEIHTAAEDLLGQRIPRSTVKNCLANNCGSATGRFVRLERGRYCVAKSSRG